MVSNDSPLDRLRRLVAEAASGEFICASPTSETHVYLQSGRIAWATDSKRPFAFAAHLQRETAIDTDTFSHVVEECRRERLPLGETLVEWGLATWATVRNSLAHQIGDALRVLSRIERAQTLFLSRKYAEYDEHLTFELSEFIGDSSRSRPAEDRAPGKIQTSVLTEDRPDLATQLRATVEGLAWVEIYEGERVVDCDPPSENPLAPAPVMRTTLLDGADFMALRSAHGSLVGSRFSEERQLWCGIATGSTFGSVLAAVGALALGPKALEGNATRSEGVAWCLGDVGCGIAAELRSFMQGAPDVLSTLVLGAATDDEPVAAFGVKALAPEDCVDIARRRARTFASLGAASDVGAGDLGSLGFYLRTMASGEGDLWCFGAELGEESRTTVWLFVDRRNAQGLGWAYLSALTRALGRVPPESRG